MEGKEINEALEGIKTKVNEKISEETKSIKADVETVKTSVNEMTGKVDSFIAEEKKKAEKFKGSVKDVVKSFVSDNADKIKELKAQGNGIIELNINKVVADMTTGSATNPDGIPELQGVQIAPPSDVNLKIDAVTSMVTTIPTNQASYAYTDTLPKDGDYTFLEEGEIKPQIDFKIETRYAAPVKTAAWIKLTDECVTDIPQMQSIANDLLRKKHDIKKSKGILFGDGISPNPTGATVYGRTFVAGSMSASLANGTANIMDVINACITDIYTTHNYVDEMNYMPNVVMINPVDFFINFTSAKDANGLPLYPQAMLFNRVVIGGVTIIPYEDIPAGKIFVADMSKYNITDYVGYTVKIGWVNDDFIKNQFVILGESRFHSFVKELDKQAFIYDDIATIKTAIEAAAV